MARVKPALRLLASIGEKLFLIAFLYFASVKVEEQSRSLGLLRIAFHDIALLSFAASVFTAAFFFYKTKRKNFWLGVMLAVSLIAIAYNRAYTQTALLYSSAILVTYAVWLAWKKHGSKATDFILGGKPNQQKTRSKENSGKTFEEKLESTFNSTNLNFKKASKDQDPDYEINTKNGKTAVLVELGKKKTRRILEKTLSKSRQYNQVILITTQAVKEKIRERMPDLNAVVLTENKALDHFTISI